MSAFPLRPPTSVFQLFSLLAFQLSAFPLSAFPKNRTECATVAYSEMPNPVSMGRMTRNTNRSQKPKPPLAIARHPAWRRAIQRLNEALERTARHSDPDREFKKLQLVRYALFGDAAKIEEPKTKDL
ncbi:MAG: hypothetical protein ABSE16_19310 [Verrucomicrobiota bacterium]|jgi:hypothetical protein